MPVGAAMILASLNFSISFVAFGEITETFGTSETTVSWALTAFSITIGALTVPGGWAADRYGRARVFVGGLALFVTGSAFVAVAPTVGWLIAARVVQAAGVAFQSPAMLALMLDAFGPTRRATAVGLTGGLGGVAAAAGPAVGGALVEAVGWRWTFAANLPVGLVVLVILVRTLHFGEGETDRAVPDLVGAALMVGAVAGFILGIVQSDDWGFADRRTMGAVMGSLVLALVLTRRSRRHPNPILRLELFAIPSFRAGVVLQILVAGSFGAVFLIELQFLTTGWGYSLFEAGLIIAAIPAVGGPLSIVNGRLADRYGHRVVILPGMACMIIAAVLLVVLVDSEPALLTVWLPLNLLYSVGVGLAHSACQAVAVNEVPAANLGIGAAMARISMEVGNAVTAAVAISLLARADVPVDALRWTLIVVVGLTVTALPVAWRLPRTARG